MQAALQHYTRVELKSQSLFVAGAKLFSASQMSNASASILFPEHSMLCSGSVYVHVFMSYVGFQYSAYHSPMVVFFINLFNERIEIRNKLELLQICSHNNENLFSTPSKLQTQAKYICETLRRHKRHE